MLPKMVGKQTIKVGSVRGLEPKLRECGAPEVDLQLIAGERTILRHGVLNSVQPVTETRDDVLPTRSLVYS
jgi:hypothetical protein